MLHFQRTGLIRIPWSTCTRNLWHQPITKYIHMTTESGLVLSLCWCLVQGSISAIQIHFRLQNINSLISPSIIQLGICQTNCTLYPKYATAAAIQSKIKCGCDADREEECERGWKTNWFERLVIWCSSNASTWHCQWINCIDLRCSASLYMEQDRERVGLDLIGRTQEVSTQHSMQWGINLKWWPSERSIWSSAQVKNVNE